MNQIPRLAVLTLIMLCPVFTLLFTLGLNLWVQSILSLALACGLSSLLVFVRKR
jgi:hypothetical protein